MKFIYKTYLLLCTLPIYHSYNSTHSFRKAKLEVSCTRVIIIEAALNLASFFLNGKHSQKPEDFNSCYRSLAASNILLLIPATTSGYFSSLSGTDTNLLPGGSRLRSALRCCDPASAWQNLSGSTGAYFLDPGTSSMNLQESGDKHPQQAHFSTFDTQPPATGFKRSCFIVIVSCYLSSTNHTAGTALGASHTSPILPVIRWE